MAIALQNSENLAQAGRSLYGGPADLEVALLAGERQFAEIADAWNALSGSVPFRHHDWLATWWRRFRRPGDELFVPLVYDGNRQLVGLAPWFIRRDRWLGRVVQFLGSGKVCSEYLTVLTAAGGEQVVAQSLAEWLTTEAARHWDLLDLDGVDRDDAALDSLVAELATQGHAVFERDRERTWRVGLSSSWEEFLGRLSKGRRAKIRAHERRLLDGGVTLRQAHDVATLQEGLDVFDRLHRARRLTLGDEGCSSAPGFHRFLEEAAEPCLRANRLRLQWIEVRQEPAAIEIDLLGGDTLYYYQTGMNPNLAEISPGWLMQVASIKRAIDDGLACFDFLRGDEAYKASWGAQPRQLVQIRIAARRPWARLRHNAWRAAVEARKLLNRSPNAKGAASGGEATC